MRTLALLSVLVVASTSFAGDFESLWMMGEGGPHYHYHRYGHHHHAPRHGFHMRGPVDIDIRWGPACRGHYTPYIPPGPTYLFGPHLGLWNQGGPANLEIRNRNAESKARRRASRIEKYSRLNAENK
jgi:hypothetical protein